VDTALSLVARLRERQHPQRLHGTAERVVAFGGPRQLDPVAGACPTCLAPFDLTDERTRQYVETRGSR
jgi:hypothetical protein